VAPFPDADRFVERMEYRLRRGAPDVLDDPDAFTAYLAARDQDTKDIVERSRDGGHIVAPVHRHGDARRVRGHRWVGPVAARLPRSPRRSSRRYGHPCPGRALCLGRAAGCGLADPFDYEVWEAADDVTSETTGTPPGTRSMPPRPRGPAQRARLRVPPVRKTGLRVAAQVSRGADVTVTREHARASVGTDVGDAVATGRGWWAPRSGARRWDVAGRVAVQSGGEASG
jgi:hypothetical protein